MDRGRGLQAYSPSIPAITRHDHLTWHNYAPAIMWGRAFPTGMHVALDQNDRSQLPSRVPTNSQGYEFGDASLGGISLCAIRIPSKMLVQRHGKKASHQCLVNRAAKQTSRVLLFLQLTCVWLSIYCLLHAFLLHWSCLFPYVRES